MNPELHLALESGLVTSREHPALADVITSAHRSGRLVRLLRGVYALPALAGDPLARIAAAQRYHPNVTITGAAAAKVSWWPDIELGEVTAACPTSLTSSSGYRFHKRRIHPDLRYDYEGWRITHPALTALDLVDELGGVAFDEGFRRHAVNLAGLRWALRLTPQRPGNRERRWLVDDSVDVPWSELERRGHRLLRQAGISGWTTNFRVVIGGQICYLDAAFKAAKLGLEFDGWRYHGSREAFVLDRVRANRLVMDGWRLLRFTDETIADLVPTVASLIGYRR